MPTALKRKSRDIDVDAEVGSTSQGKVAKVERGAGNKKSRRDVVVEVEQEVDEDEEMGSPSSSASDAEVQDEEDEDSWTGIPSTTPQTTQNASTATKPSKPPTALELRSITDASTLFHSSSFKLQIDALLPSVRPKVFSSSASGSSRGQALDKFLLELHSILTSLPPSSHQSPIHPLLASSSLSSSSNPSQSQSIAIPYPLPHPTSTTQHKVSFPGIGPITLLGSWATKTSVKPKDGRAWGVDLGVEMRGEMFTEKDYLNSRYFHKRAYFLGKVAEGIQAHFAQNNTDAGGKEREKGKEGNGNGRGGVEMYYESPNGDPRLTKLVLVPKEKELVKLGVRVYIIPVLPSSSPTSSSPSHPIPIHRLSPTQCNLRVTTTDEEKRDEETEEDRLPTPIYNTTLLLSLLPRIQLLSQHSLINSVPSFRDALALVRVWANQRGYGDGCEGDVGAGAGVEGNGKEKRGNGGKKGEGNGKEERVGYKVVAGFEGRGYLWGALLEFIIVGEEVEKGVGGKGEKARKGRKGLGRGLSSYQMFRGVLDLLAKHDFTLHPLLTKSPSSYKFTKEEYLQSQQEGGVFVGSDGLVNLLSGIPVGSLNLLRHDALKTLQVLDSREGNGDPFKEVWLTEERGLSGRFDEVVCIDLSSARKNPTSLPSILNHGSPTSSLLHHISTLLHIGLGDRVKVISLLHSPLGLRKVSEANPESLGKVWVGLIFSDEGRAFRVVDHGPSLSSSTTSTSSSAINPTQGGGEGGNEEEEEKRKVKEFRELWGEKSELRRFKDGRIGESVVWQVGSLEERREVPRMVVQYLLRYHFGISSDSSTSSIVSGGNEKEGDDRAGKDIDTNMEPKTPQSRNQYTPLLLLPTPISSIYLTSNSQNKDKISTGTKGALGAFDGLVRVLKSLSSSDGGREGRGGGEAPIPLSILNVHPVAPGLRYTSTFSPVPVPSSIASLLPPFSTSTNQWKWIEEMEILVEFERSSRWGDELRYAESMKMAFLERVGGELMRAVEGLVARVVVGSAIHTHRAGGAGGEGRRDVEGGRGGEDLGRDESYLEVLTPEGWAFKLRIWVDREAVLLDRVIQDSLRPIPPALLPSSSTTTTSSAQIKLELAKKARLLHQAREKKELYQRRYVMGPRHHRAVGNLVHRYHAYAGTVRLVKRWFGGHWLLASSSSSSSSPSLSSSSSSSAEQGPLDAVSEEAIEILVARVFVGDGADLDLDSEEGEGGRQERPSVPGSKERGFALVMRMLKDWDWTQEGGLGVKMYGSRAAISYGEEEEVQGSVSTSTTGNATTSATAGKKVNKNLLGSGTGAGGEEAKGVWRLVTEVDPTGKMWTKYGPDGVVAQRIRALAGATWEVLCKGMEGGRLDVKAMFVHPTEDYDVLVRLDRSVLPRYHQNVTPSLSDLFPQRKGKYANITSSSSDVTVRPGFDPARLLFHDLQRVYKNTFKIFHDVYGGDTYGIVWDPSLKEERGFRVFGRYSMRPVESGDNEKKTSGKEKKEKNLVKLNEAAILDEIERMGRGLVKEIVVQVGGRE